MSKKIVIIGGGIIGLCTAYYMQKEGFEVTIVDQSDFSTGASFINAGYITPSHLISLAAPGIISKGIKWMFDASSPFYVKPRFDMDFLKWSLAFKKSATKAKVEKAIPHIKNFNLLSRDLYETMLTSNDFDFHYERKGLLMCYKTEKAGEEEWATGKMAIEQGLGVQNLSKEAVRKLEPTANFDIKGAVYYDSDAHMTPADFMPRIIAFLKSIGVRFLKNSKVIDFEVTNKKITKIKTLQQTIEADEFVLAAGSWSALLSKKLGLKIPIQAGKGYSIHTTMPTGITIPAILCEAKVAVTPMNGFTRFAGTMEFSGINHTINSVRVAAISKAVSNYYTGVQLTPQENKNAACGLRPCSPDGLPYIGKSTKCENLTIATGHAMMGWSLGPATGKLVSEILANKKLSLDMDPYHPERKF
mgnify:CR=1 FL=1